MWDIPSGIIKFLYIVKKLDIILISFIQKSIKQIKIMYNYDNVSFLRLGCVDLKKLGVKIKKGQV